MNINPKHLDPYKCPAGTCSLCPGFIDVTVPQVKDFPLDKGEFTVKDSGQREVFATGMNRDVEIGKLDWTLIYDGPMLRRWAEHLTKGAVKYKPRNWLLAATDEELARYRRSLARHYHQYMDGEVDEDHAAAIFFNVNGIEYVKDRLRGSGT